MIYLTVMTTHPQSLEMNYQIKCLTDPRKNSSVSAGKERWVPIMFTFLGLLSLCKQFQLLKV